MRSKKTKKNIGLYRSLYTKIKVSNPEAISRMLKNYPCFISHMLNDLMHLEGFSETEIGFGSSIPLETIRHIISGNLTLLNQEISLALLGLYARIFCNWWNYQDD